MIKDGALVHETYYANSSDTLYETDSEAKTMIGALVGAVHAKRMCFLVVFVLQKQQYHLTEQWCTGGLQCAQRHWRPKQPTRLQRPFCGRHSLVALLTCLQPPSSVYAPFRHRTFQNSHAPFRSHDLFARSSHVSRAVGP